MKRREQAAFWAFLAFVFLACAYVVSFAHGKDAPAVCVVDATCGVACILLCAKAVCLRRRR